MLKRSLILFSVCHCQFCQRRTGVPLTCNAYFPKSKVRLEGEHKIYSRDAADGRKMDTYFCPTCGSTVGWNLDLRPSQFGVAVGCFNDRKMCASWATPPKDILHFPRGRSVPITG